MAGVVGAVSGGSYTVRVRLDPAAVSAVCGGDIADGLIRAAGKTRLRARQNIQQAGRVRTGRMASDIAVSPVHGTISTIQYIDVTAMAPYATFQEHGTRGKVMPPGKFMRFIPKGGSAYVFARRVRGIKGAHFMRDAAKALTPEDFGSG